MVDPFAMAATALFHAPGSEAATYIPLSGPWLPTRIIRGAPDASATFGGGGIVQETNQFQVLRSAVPEPQAGDQMVIGDDNFTITGVPMLDAERVTWNCTALPA